MTLDADPPQEMHEIAVEAFGVRLGVGTPLAELVPRIGQTLPPHAQECDPASVDHHFTIAPRAATTFDVRYDVRDGEPVDQRHVSYRIATHVDLEFGLAMVESYIRGSLALTAPDHLFLAGGVVAIDGRLIVLPGFGVTGKTTLVSALVQNGAQYYSDEYAVLDEDGLVHPYPPAPPSSANGNPGAVPQPLPVGAVVITRYRPGAEWQPRRLSPGESVLSLVPYAVPYQEDAERCTRFIMRAMEAAPPVLMSDRGEADEMASLLLGAVEQALTAAD
jgi:hypothetical protein